MQMYPEEDSTLSRILSIDFGLKRIGLALSDPLLTFAYPYETINNDHKLFEKLKIIIKEKDISKIILGIPENDKQGSTSIVNDVKIFKTKLENNFKIEVILWDESYTSVISKQRVVESVSKKSKRRNKGLIDQNSAAVILQEYLDSIK